MIIESNKIGRKALSLSDRVVSAAYILRIPVNVDYGTLSLPGYVFNYIYDYGTLEDMPWISIRDRDIESRIYRTYRIINQIDIAKACVYSPLIISVNADYLVHSLMKENIGLNTFETALRTHLLNFKTKL